MNKCGITAALPWILAACLSGVFFFRKLTAMKQEHLRLHEKSRNDQKVIAALQEKLRTWQQYVDQTNLRLHEVRSRALVMQTQLQKGEVEAVEAMLSEQSRSHGSAGVEYTQHRLLNALLGWGGGQAQAWGIPVQYTIEGVSGSIGMEDCDLAGMVTNLLENAVEANLSVNPAERHITFSMKAYRGTMIVECVNPCNMEKRQIKDNPHRHGYGLRIVGRIAEKYHGKVNITRRDGRYSVVIALEVEVSVGV